MTLMGTSAMYSPGKDIYSSLRSARSHACMYSGTVRRRSPDESFAYQGRP
jgi:hypothetical protein